MELDFTSIEFAAFKRFIDFHRYFNYGIMFMAWTPITHSRNMYKVKNIIPSNDFSFGVFLDSI